MARFLYRPSVEKDIAKMLGGELRKRGNEILGETLANAVMAHSGDEYGDDGEHDDDHEAADR